MAKGIKMQEVWASYKPSENIPFITETFPSKSELQSIHFHLHARPERLHTSHNPEESSWKREWKPEIDRLIPFKNLDKCQWETGEYVTADDGTISSKARMNGVTFNKLKPTKNRWGLRQDNLADGSMHRVGYLLDSIPQLESVEEEQCLHDEGKVPQRVWKLLSPLFGSGRKAVGDSGYMSNLELHCQAYRQNLGLLGTVNKRSKHLPAFNAREKKEYIKNLGPGNSVRFYLISRREPITFTIYRDGVKRIFFYDNYLRLEPNFDVNLPYKRWRKERKEYEDSTQPLVRKLYNEFKSAVDTNNQLLCFSNYHFKNRRKLFSLFWGKLIQFGVCNPFILFKESQSNPKKVSFRNTLIDLAFIFQRQWLRKRGYIAPKHFISSFRHKLQPKGPHILIKTQVKKRCAIYGCGGKSQYACDTCQINGNLVHLCRLKPCTLQWLPHTEQENIISAIGHIHTPVRTCNTPYCQKCKRRVKTVGLCSVCPDQRLCLECFNSIHHL